MSNNNDLMTDSPVEQRLKQLKNIPARDPLKAASGRARFLREAAEYRQSIAPVASVRPPGWILRMQKGKIGVNALVALILAASLLLGGSITVAAAQDDLPNQSLYQLKLWTENATLALNDDPQEQASLLMNMAQTRVEEIATLTEMGITPPDQVRERLEKHLQQALMLAAGMDGSARDRVLLQLRDRLREQDRLIEQLQMQASGKAEPLLTKTRQTLQTELGLVDEGITDPQGFSHKIKNQLQNGQEEVTPEPNQQGEPVFGQNGQNGQPSGNGNGSGSNAENDMPGGPNSGKPHNGNNGNSGNQPPGGPNPNGSQGGSGPGTGNDGGKDSGSGGDGGGGGGNK